MPTAVQSAIAKAIGNDTETAGNAKGTTTVASWRQVGSQAVIRFVGAGGFEDALATSERMAEICLGHNGQFPVLRVSALGLTQGRQVRGR